MTEGEYMGLRYKDMTCQAAQFQSVTTSQVISLYLSPIYSPSVMCLEEVTSHGNAKRWFAVCTGEQTKVRDQLDQLTAGGQAGNSELVMNPLPITKHTINTLKQ